MSGVQAGAFLTLRAKPYSVILRVPLGESRIVTTEKLGILRAKRAQNDRSLTAGSEFISEVSLSMRQRTKLAKLQTRNNRLRELPRLRAAALIRR
jgi:hypothetical protein